MQSKNEIKTDPLDDMKSDGVMWVVRLDHSQSQQIFVNAESAGVLPHDYIRNAVNATNKDLTARGVNL